MPEPDPDPLNVLTLAAAKSALAEDLTPEEIDELDVEHINDDEILLYVTAVSRRLDRLCGPIVQREITEEEHDGGSPTIWLSERPVAEVLEVLEYSGTTSIAVERETNQDKPAAGYRLDRLDSAAGYGRRVRRRGAGAAPGGGRGGGHGVVTDGAGRGEATAPVAPLFTTAAKLILPNLWRHRDPAVESSSTQFVLPHSNFPRFAIPNAASELLAGEIWNRPTVA